MQSIVKQSNTQRMCAFMLAVIAWFAIALQLYLTTGSVSNFFSYFTILCNLLIAVSLTFSSLAPSLRLGRYFSKISVQSAIALYIFIVCLVYNLVLRGLVVLSGWNLFVDTLLHVIIPLLYILYYIVYTPKGHLKWKDGIHWIYFPLAYLLYSLIRGNFVHWYPYPFLNVIKLGYTKVLINTTGMIAVFFVAGLLLIALNRSFKK